MCSQSVCLDSILRARLQPRRVKRSFAIGFVVFCAALFVVSGLSLRGDSAKASAPTDVPSPIAPSPPLPAPPRRPVARPLAGSDVAEIQRLTPRVEIWRPNGQRPQTPARRGKRTDWAFVTGAEPVTIRLQFDRRVAGARVVVIAANGFTFNPPQQVLTVSSGGDCVVIGQLAEGAPRGHFVVRCGMIETVVSLARTSLANVQAEEVRMGGRP